MSLMRPLCTVWQSFWAARWQSTARRIKSFPRLEPLEVRTLLAGEFTDLGNLGLAGVDASSTAWGDYDNDGDLDALLTGRDSTNTPIAKVYRNNGDNTFTDVNAGLTGAFNSSAAWGDSDNDGDLDILLTGRDSSFVPVAKVYRNNGDNTFTDMNAGLTGAFGGAVSWGDSDNDGDLDILLAGRDGSFNVITQVYRNNGDNTFTDVNAGLTGSYHSSVSWGDSDGDGDLDILLVGDSPDGLIAKVYRNDGNNTFTDVNAGLTGAGFAAAAWGDSDNDGDLDILLSGRGSNLDVITKVYRNDGNNTFTDLNAGLAGVYRGSTAWGDADNDGDLDILLSGKLRTGSLVTKVYRNNGDSTFTDVDAGLTGVWCSAAAWGDNDNDGDLDILLTGAGSSYGSRITKVYRNNASAANTAPAVSTNLTATFVSSTSMTLSWSTASDGQTPAAGLSYNLRVGTTPGGSDVVSAMASTASGTRRLPGVGPVQGTVYTLKGLDPTKTYYWSVQAIDAAFAGSEFTAEESFRPVPFTHPGFTDLGTLGLAGVDLSSAAWGDVDNDDDLDAVLTGRDGTNARIAEVYRNNNDGTFTDLNAGLAGVRNGSVSWGDLDGDNDLDLVLAGEDGTNTRIAKVYRNTTTTTINVPAVAATRTATTVTASAAIPASRTFNSSSGSGQFTVTANTAGVAGNAIRVRFVDSAGNSQALSASLSGNDITVMLATDGTGSLDAAANTADLIAGAINGISGGLVTATGNSQTGGFTAASFVNLQNGAAAVSAEQITLTAVTAGVAGNSLQVSITSGASNAVSVSITGNSISIVRSAGTTTAQLVNFLATDSSAGAVAARALVTAAGTGTTAINANVAIGALTGGTDAVVTHNISFTEIANPGLTGVTYGSVAWGDADNDGDLDILLTGIDATATPLSRVYRNNGDSTFTDLNAGLPGVRYGSATWGDADHDGNLDVLLTGQDGTGTGITRVYRSNGDGTFTDLNAGLVGVYFSAAAWGDYDNDGDLDVLLNGADSSFNRFAKVYRNNGDATFSDLNLGLPGVLAGALAWGDYDNDGDLDLLLTGRNDSFTNITKIYRNDGSGAFSELNASLTGVYTSAAAWGDADGDGDLDLLLTGKDNTGTGIVKVYRNDDPTVNPAPGVPTNLTATIVSNTSLRFTWTAPTDAQTPAAGLSYNLRVGTTPGGNDTFSSMADSPNGIRLVPRSGPIQGTSLTLQGLDPEKTYYWSVQAIDTGLRGSAFAAEKSASIPFADLGGAGIADFVYSSVAWGDYDNDGDLDALLTGQDGGGYIVTAIYRNNGDNSFTDINAGLIGVSFGSSAWGDYDNDGDIDLLLTGKTDDSSVITRVYRNNGDSTFTDINAGLVGVYISSAAWGDSDNDGDLDILLAGETSSHTRITRVYRNNGNSTFTDLNAGFTGVHWSSVAWGDSENDGDLDFLVTGIAVNQNRRITKLYRNDGNNSFVDVANTGISEAGAGSVTWGDYDNDGDLDVLITGDNNVVNDRIARVYRNNGSNSFTDMNAGLTGVRYSSGQWGDYDNDGDLDILLMGKSATNAEIATIYRNNGDGTFTDIYDGFTGMFWGSVAWGDTDNDGDLDVLLSGRRNNYQLITKIYRNNAATANTAPNAPTNLTATAPSNTSLTFNWTTATDGQTPAAGLSYNLRVGTTPGASDVFSTMASGANGSRRVADAGPIQGTSYTLNGLTFGQTYYWSVQAVDTAFAGSPFAAETASVVNRIPTIGGALANQDVNDNSTLAPFAALTVSDADTQAMFARVTIGNGVNRGDFTPASQTGWTRTVNGADIVYTRSFASAAHIGDTVQAAIRTFVFQPRANMVQVGSTETTNFSVFVNDQLANATNSITSVRTTSVNDAPVTGSGNGNLLLNDTASSLPFLTATIADPDTQDLFLRVTILNGVFRGDFPAATNTGWTRTVTGNDLVFTRYFSTAANVGAAAQFALQSLVFQPRSNAIKPNTTETTAFTVFANDGVSSANSSLTTVVTSVNDAPVIGGASATVTVNDNATVSPLGTLTIGDPDTQEMLATVTILNGVVRGDFTNAIANGWTTRFLVGNNITYKRYFNPQANVGAVVQAAFRALTFQPRTNAIKPGTTELTDVLVSVSDGVANPPVNTGTRITTISVNDAPTIGGASNSIAVNDNATINPFPNLTVSDPDRQEMLATVTILNGVVRGDFTNAAAEGWVTRYVIGNNVTYKRYFNPQANIGSVVQAAFRALVFQPRMNAINPGTTVSVRWRTGADV